jgi:methylglutaconyl-CoA hydratase
MSEILTTYESRLPAAIITMNRARKRNALSRDLIARLTAAFRRAADDHGVRVVILTGAGSAFCAGMDLEELQGAMRAEREVIWDDAFKLSSLYDLIYTLPKPTIAAVNGHAVAGGAGLATVCDLALAVPAARFGYPEVRRGLVAAMVLPHLLRHVGERMARYLLLTGELIDAAQAEQAGLINKVVPDDQLLSVAFDWATALDAGGPQALASTKDLLRRCSRQALTQEEFANASAEPRLGDECQQGLAAFFAKQPVPWIS